ncbi:MAG TPA: hypothetical protein VM511_13895, partial [Luteolibacter sp.]|nr:hypothetical protein [Luteolibacter sp.]
VYVEHKGGNLFYGGERLRLWGGVGYGSIPRMRRMGFNAWRVWPVADKAYDERSIVSGDFAASAKGDGSEMDRIDRMYADFKSEGFFLMATQLMGVMPAKLLMRDDSFVAGGDDWEAWKAAVKEMPGSADAGGSANFRRLAFVDERAKQARLRHAVNFLNRVNPYTGKRYAEEEHIAVWELDNELGIVRHLLEGGGAKWPKYFRGKLDAKWSAWVSGRYADEKDLLGAWGRLEDGERYGSLKAVAVGAGNDGAAKRAGDFTRFTIELADAFYQELRTLCRKQAAEGAGVAVAAFSFDTQYRPSIPWIYQQTRGDVANFGMYFWDTTSQIAKQPAAYVMDGHTVDDKVTVIYETNQARPSPYRTEYPFRLAALASWQDWDAVFFHYWGGNGGGENDEEYMGRPMKYMTASHYWDGVHHESDPAMTSMMALGGRMFLGGMIPAAPKPAIYRVGAKGIFSGTFANGIGMKDDVFSRGARLRFEPDGDFDLIKENAVSGPEDGAVHGGPVTWDWRKGRLIIDTPTAKVFVGPAPAEGWKFGGGITLSGISKPWISFALASADGRPLTECSKAWVSSMADAVNTGFEFDWNVKGGPTEQAKAIRNMGAAPVIVDRVDYTVSFPTKMKWQVDAYDFAVRRLQETSGTNSVVRVRSQPRSGEVPNDRPQEIWMNVLKISGRGEAADPVNDPSAGAMASASPEEGGEASDGSLAGFW